MNIMSIVCKIKKHRWKNGRCARCGAEHEPHEWAPQPGLCEEKCVICGKVQKVKHNFSNRGGCEYICTNCGERQLLHRFVRSDGCVEVCAECGIERVSHRWCTVKKKRRNGDVVTLPGCRCAVCGAPNPDGSHAFAAKEENGRRVRVCMICGAVADLPVSSAPDPMATLEMQVQDIAPDLRTKE